MIDDPIEIENRLSDWWIEQAGMEASKLAPKAVEYGSYDLQLIGQILRTVSHQSTPSSDMELGIIFYLIGKIARLASAVRDGNLPSSDTFLDISIYARMALYIRETGRWP